jgi:hypothetical protein
MQEIKFRLVNPGLQPRRTKLEMPGWAGKAEPRTDGSHEYAWHCLPFTEGAQYGIEIFYPYENELHVTKKDGSLAFEGDFGPPPPEFVSGPFWILQWPLFASPVKRVQWLPVARPLTPRPAWQGSSAPGLQVSTV